MENMKTPITITEIAPGKFSATSSFNNETTAAILLNLSLNFVRKAAIERHEENKTKQGSIINPHTMQTIPKGN